MAKFSLEENVLIWIKMHNLTYSEIYKMQNENVVKVDK